MSLVIGVDGLGASGWLSADTPHIDSLVNGGFHSDYAAAYTLHAIAGGVLQTETQQQTVSGPGWSTILTGVWKDRHQVIDNSFSNPNYEDNPTYLEILEESVDEIYTVSVVNWEPIDKHIISSGDDPNSSIDFHRSTQNDRQVFDLIAQQQNDDLGVPSAFFVSFDDVDAAGHSSGSYSQRYLDEINDTDSLIGLLLDEVRNRANFVNEDWQIIVTADHGHVPTGGHGGQSGLERSIPFIVVGKDIQPGHIPSGASHADVAPTVLNHFELPTPDYFFGTAQGQTVLSDSNSSGLLDGLVRVLPLDGDATNSLIGFDGVIEGEIEYRQGRFGKAAYLSSLGRGNINLGEDLGFSSSDDFSISFWARFSGYSGNPPLLSNKNGEEIESPGLEIALDSLFSLDVDIKPSIEDRLEIHPFGVLSLDNWQNIVLTFDRDDQARIFVNGALAGEVSIKDSGKFASTLPWRLFNDGTGISTEGTMRGLSIDEFVVWNRKLSEDEILLLTETSISVEPILDKDSPRVIINPLSGNITIDTSGLELGDIIISSVAGIFNGPNSPDWGLPGRGDIDRDDKISMPINTRRGFNGISILGDGVIGELPDDFDILSDVSVSYLHPSGTLLGNTQIIVVPEPSSMILLTLGLLTVLTFFRNR